MERQWPVKISLVHPKAPFMQKDSLVIASDCTLLVNPDLSRRFNNGETFVIGCPILEDPARLEQKFELIADETGAKKVEVYTMEVPCCHAIHMMTTKSFSKRKDVKLERYIIRVMTGKVEHYTGRIDESMMEMERRVHAGLGNPPGHVRHPSEHMRSPDKP